MIPAQRDQAVFPWVRRRPRRLSLVAQPNRDNGIRDEEPWDLLASTARSFPISNCRYAVATIGAALQGLSYP